MEIKVKFHTFFSYLNGESLVLDRAVLMRSSGCVRQRPGLLFYLEDNWGHGFWGIDILRIIQRCASQTLWSFDQPVKTRLDCDSATQNGFALLCCHSHVAMLFITRAKGSVTVNTWARQGDLTLIHKTTYKNKSVECGKKATQIQSAWKARRKN